VVSADIINYTVSGTRRVDFIVSASYNTPTQTVIQALHEAAKVPGVLTDPAPFAALNRYGENSIEYTLRVWTAAENYWDVNFAVNENIREAFQKGGVEFSYPHLNIHVAK
jgi:small conductance mechanosensitive channel